jgi:hypothetical protein
VPDDVVLAELLAATQAAVNHSRELLSIARRLLVNVEGGPDVPVETRAEYWLRFAEMDAAHMRIQDILDRWPFLRAGPSTVQWRPSLSRWSREETLPPSARRAIVCGSGRCADSEADRAGGGADAGRGGAPRAAAVTRAD